MALCLQHLRIRRLLPLTHVVQLSVVTLRYPSALLLHLSIRVFLIGSQLPQNVFRLSRLLFLALTLLFICPCHHEQRR